MAARARTLGNVSGVRCTHRPACRKAGCTAKHRATSSGMLYRKDMQMPIGSRVANSQTASPVSSCFPFLPIHATKNRVCVYARGRESPQRSMGPSVPPSYPTEAASHKDKGRSSTGEDVGNPCHILESPLHVPDAAQPMAARTPSAPPPDDELGALAAALAAGRLSRSATTVSSLRPLFSDSVGH